MSTKLSIIVPVHNTADYLPNCLDSLINQIYKDIQIIIVNDHSTDESHNIIEKYCNKYSNITYILNTNKSGVGYARNIALKHIKTEYVTFLDSDDWIDSSTYKKTIDYLEDHPECEIAIWGILAEQTSNNMSVSKVHYEYSNIIENRFAIRLLCKSFNYDITISSMLGNKIFRSDFLKNNSIKFSHNLFEDTLFSFITFYFAKKICLIGNTNLHYYQREGSIMHSFSDTYVDEMISVLFEIKSFLEINNAFEEYHDDYYSLLSKGLIKLIDMIFSTQQNIKAQKKFLSFMFDKLTCFFSISELIDNMDIEIVKVFLGKQNT